MNDDPRSNSHYLLPVFACVAICLLCALSWPLFQSASVQNSAASVNGKIAFVTNRNGPPGEIYVMDPDGSNQTRITN